MSRPLIRIPYTDLFPPPQPIPRTANSLPGAVAALQEFLLSPTPRDRNLPGSTVVLTGAGLSVSSGLSDYRGTNGTYRKNKTYRPIYYHEFLANHEARKRYWARSFLGWGALRGAGPNAGHYAVRDLWRMGLVGRVVTQNVDSFHAKAHPELSTLELHGYLRAVVCVTCRNEMAREEMQGELARLNPRWDEFLRAAVTEGAHAIRTNPDGDAEVPGAPYTTFRYPACPTCLRDPPDAGGERATVEVDGDGAWSPTSTAGILKPAVVMFGENIADRVKQAAEEAIDGAGRLLVLATSLATYSAWRLAKRAKDRGMPIAIVNMGGVRGEEAFFADLDPNQTGAHGVRVDMSTDVVLPALVKELQQNPFRRPLAVEAQGKEVPKEAVFRDMVK
ncbi:hypothetical protein VTJ49DRAFT_3744 [Mycothermus thermophilus]|uniref:Deacetylase sirtuin-type domain-containing protein n=1 Tax=Humicola insolens TaxID=85995 RepID=A0ABR3V8R8_HUMIN